MKNTKVYTLKPEYKGKQVTRKAKVSGSKVTFDADKVDEKDYHKWADVGFEDLFKEGSAELTKEEKAYNKRVERLEKAGFKLVAEDTFALEVEGKDPVTVDKVKEAEEKDFNAFIKPYEAK